MKSLLLLLLILILGITNINAQSLYTPGIITQGKNACYYSTRATALTIRVRNIQNVDTLRNMYFDNGKVVPADWQLGSQFDFDYQKFLQTFKDEFTSEELNQLKGIKGFFQVSVVADKAGNALEMEFAFCKIDPVLSKLDPDRLFKLETKFKKLLKIRISNADRDIKHVKYLVEIDYKDL